MSSLPKVGSGVGVNPSLFDATKCLGVTIDCCALESDVTLTAAEIIQLAIDQGMTLPNGDPITGIHSIQVNLKPVNGEGDIFNGTDYDTKVATTSDATFIYNNIPTNIDSGGYRRASGHTSVLEDITSQVTGVEIKAGSIVSKDVIFI